MRKTTHKNYKNAFFLAAATKCRYMHQTYKFRHFYELKQNSKLQITYSKMFLKYNSKNELLEIDIPFLHI